MKVNDQVYKWPFIGEVRAIGHFRDGTTWCLCEEDSGGFFVATIEELRPYKKMLPLVTSKY